jgi:hypothetical protein
MHMKIERYILDSGPVVYSNEQKITFALPKAGFSHDGTHPAMMIVLWRNDLTARRGESRYKIGIVNLALHVGFLGRLSVLSANRGNEKSFRKRWVHYDQQELKCHRKTDAMGLSLSEITVRLSMDFE